ncbi:MAG: transglutaminase-like domain-containing protein [Planctomycetota bacterium]|nr:transglutaminase-like domain-containing protein [Planctomycetota bacterium]
MKRIRFHIMPVIALSLAAIQLSAEDVPEAKATQVEVPGPKETSIKINYGFIIKEVPAGTKKLHVWIPMPQDSALQKLNSFKMRSSVGVVNYSTYRDYENHNAFMHFDLSRHARMGKEDISIDIVFNVTRHASHDTWSEGSDEKLKPLVRKRYLSAHKLVPVEGNIADEAWESIGTEDAPIARARLLYNHIVETVQYDKSVEGWGRGDAIFACQARKGNCTDFHSLYIGEARAVNIPSRFIMGFPIPEGASGEIAGYHCWAEFFIDGRGWLPIDASEANKHPEKKEAFFTGLDANRIQFSIGRDIRVPKTRTRLLNYFIYPHIEVNGVPHESFEKRFSYKEVFAEEAKK